MMRYSRSNLKENSFNELMLNLHAKKNSKKREYILMNTYEELMIFF